MKRLATLALLAAAFPASANDVFKCVTNGRTVYQNTPCEGPAVQKQLKADRSGALLGCYTVDMPGFDGIFEVKRSDKGDLRLEFGEPGRRTQLPMKVATGAEVKLVADTFRQPLTEGVSVRWDENSRDKRPIGVYKGTDKLGQEQLFAHFVSANGPAVRKACP